MYAYILRDIVAAWTGHEYYMYAYILHDIVAE